MSVEELWDHWKRNVLHSAQQTCTVPTNSPQKQQSTGPPRPWITPQLLTEIKHKHKLYRTYLHDKTKANWELFTSQRNKVTTLLRQAKSAFVLSSSDPQHFNHTRLHQIINCLKTKTTTPIPDLTSDSHTATTSLDKANMLNKFFIQQSAQSVTNCTNDIPNINTTPNITSTLQTLTTTPAEVQAILEQLDTRKSPGHDGIPTRLLKEAAAEISPSLSALFNHSFRHGQTPQEWMRCNSYCYLQERLHIIPNELPSDISASLLPVVSKVQERIVYNKLYSHIKHHLPTCQSGFRQHDGTELQLARLVHQISANRDAGQHVSACFFDLSKAFDRVWHSGLLRKLEHYGVESCAHQWLSGYLSDRRQRVQVDGIFSSWLSVPAGVPQGSVLGPLLFLIYTIDLPQACTNNSTTCSQFADDTALVTSTPTAHDTTTTERQLQQAANYNKQ